MSERRGAARPDDAGESEATSATASQDKSRGASQGKTTPEPHKHAQRAARVSDVFGLDGHDLLPDATGDEWGRGWGDERAGTDASDDADLRRFLDEKPPHHL